MSEEIKVWTANPTLTHKSLAKYVTEHSGVELTPEQAHAVLSFHGKWQKDPARVTEREAEKLERDAALADAKVARDAAAKEKKEKAAELKAQKDAAKKAKDAADAGDDSDLDSVDEDATDDEGAPTPRKRRAKAPAGAGSAASF